MRGGRLAVLVLAAAAAAAALAPGAAHAWTGRCCGPWYTPGPVVVSPDGRFAYVSNNDALLVLARNPGTGALTLVDGYDGLGPKIALSPDGQNMYRFGGFGNTDGIQVWDRNATTGRLTAAGGVTRSQSWTGQDLLVSPDGTQLFATSDNAGVIEVYDRDPDTGALAHATDVEAYESNPDSSLSTYELAMPADGRFLYVGSEEGVLVFARADDGSLQRIQSGLSPFSSYYVEVSPDGHRVYSGGSGRSAFDRDPATGLLTPVAGTDPGIGHGTIVVSPDSEHLYVGGGGKVNELRATADGLEYVRTYREPFDGKGLRGALAIGRSPDGKHVYVSAMPEDTGTGAGRIGVFEPGVDGTLTYRSVFVGPYLNGVPPWEQHAPELLINDGDEYTNDPHVTLTVRYADQNGILGIRVSNDGGFADAQDLSSGGEFQPDLHFEWTLATSGPERLPKTVYARAGGMNVPDGVLTDDIILDERSPQVLSAKVRGKRLRIRARDRLSGLARMQITSNRRKPGRWRPFHRRPKRHVKPGERVWVRVVDRARNRSHWRRAVAKQRQR